MHHWLPAVKRAGLEPLRFHDLRHTCASILIAQGAHPKEIQARLRHASITTTLDNYGHLMPSLDDNLTDSLEAVYRGAKADQDVAEMWPKCGRPAIERRCGATEGQTRNSL
ncbi:MAG: tyrosine-type recombinase/integrase [Actinomycetota bacterium]